MPRRMAPWFISLATLGKCSLISMPDTEVWIGLNSPALSVPGFMSKVSLWVGPPSIHSRMQALCLVPLSWAAWAARRSNQPLIETPANPAADSRKKSRRLRQVLNMNQLLVKPTGTRGFGGLVIQSEFAAIQHGPQDVAVGFAWTFALLDVGGELGQFGRGRPARQRTEEEVFDDLLRRVRLDRLVEQRGIAIHQGRIHQPQRLRDAVLVFGRIGILVA